MSHSTPEEERQAVDSSPKGTFALLLVFAAVSAGGAVAGIGSFMTTSQIDVGGIPVLLVEITGTYANLMVNDQEMPGYMLLGAIAASEYFGGEIAERVEAFYAKVNWKWFTNPETHFPYLACYTDGPAGAPTEAIAKITNEEGFFLHWGFFGHHFHLFILAAGSPTPEFRTGDKGYYSMEADKASYGDGEEFIRARIGAAFNYQWTHCFIDFRHIEDKLGRNWFENSRHAAIAVKKRVSP